MFSEFLESPFLGLFFGWGKSGNLGCIYWGDGHRLPSTARK